MVILGHGAFAFENLDHDSLLVVLIGGEGLRLFRGNDGVARNQLSHDAANSLDALGERSHVKQKNILRFIATFSRKNASLNGCAISNSLIRVNTLFVMSISGVLDLVS